MISRAMSEEQSTREKNSSPSIVQSDYVDDEDDHDNISSPPVTTSQNPLSQQQQQLSQQQSLILRPPPLRRNRTVSKIDFCCLSEDVIRCVCANIIAHIQTSESIGYIPPEEYAIWNKENGSLVSSLPYPPLPSLL
jgi:hypothetical protein